MADNKVGSGVSTGALEAAELPPIDSAAAPSLPGKTVSAIIGISKAVSAMAKEPATTPTPLEGSPSTSTIAPTPSESAPKSTTSRPGVSVPVSPETGTSTPRVNADPARSNFGSGYSGTTINNKNDNVNVNNNTVNVTVTAPAAPAAQTYPNTPASKSRPIDALVNADKNNSGTLELKEFQSAARTRGEEVRGESATLTNGSYVGGAVQKAGLVDFGKKMDKDHSGKVTLPELREQVELAGYDVPTGAATRDESKMLSQINGAYKTELASAAKQLKKANMAHTTQPATETPSGAVPGVSSPVSTGALAVNSGPAPKGIIR